MKNADRIGNIAKQMIGVCNVIINLAEAEESEAYDEIFWDELTHAQKLVLEFTKYAFDEKAEEEWEEPTPPKQDNFDDAFFEGELDFNEGDKTDDEVVAIEEDDEEEDFEEDEE